MEASDRQFVEHLDYATAIVSRWPEWKRNVLGGDSGTSNGDKQMMSLLKWEWNCHETSWAADSQIVSKHGNPGEWLIEVDSFGVFVVSEWPEGARRTLPPDGIPRPRPSFPTLAEAKEWCEKREGELRTEKASEKASEKVSEDELNESNQ